jgi:hypothetical protein
MPFVEFASRFFKPGRRSGFPQRQPDDAALVKRGSV